MGDFVEMAFLAVFIFIGLVSLRRYLYRKRIHQIMQEELEEYERNKRN